MENDIFLRAANDLSLSQLKWWKTPIYFACRRLVIVLTYAN